MKAHAKCYLCEENYIPTDEEWDAWRDAGYGWDPANWICPACEEALARDIETYMGDEEDYRMAYYEAIYDDGHPF